MVFSSRFLSPSQAFENLAGQWRDALAICLPTGIQERLRPQRRALVLSVQTDHAVLYRYLGNTGERLGRFEPHAHPTALARVLGELDTKDRKRMRIRLPEALIIRRTVSFPAQVRKNLPQVIAYEIDRLTPFQADQVYFDFRSLETPGRGDRISLEIALCRRDLVETWVARLRQAGVPPDGIQWEGAWPEANLLPWAERPKRRPSLFGLTPFLGLLSLLLAGAALFSPLWQKTQIHAALDGELRALRVQAEAVHQVRSAIEQERRGMLQVLEQKAEQPRMVELLHELTDRLPDHTWIQTLDYRDGEVQIRGESTQAASLIGLLERAPGVEKVSFRSPVVRVATTGRERFHIAFQYHRVRPGT